MSVIPLFNIIISDATTFSTPLKSLASSYVLETGGDDETAEWDCIMNKLSIDSQTPMFQ